MSVESWLSTLSPSDLPQAVNCNFEDKENVRPLRQEPAAKVYITRKRKRLTPLRMADQFITDIDRTPRPKRKRTQLIDSAPPLSPSEDAQSSHSSLQSHKSIDDDLQSHQSGRLSPTKQMQALSDLPEPIVCQNIYDDSIDIPSDVEDLRRQMQDVADGVATLGYTVSASSVHANFCV